MEPVFLTKDISISNLKREPPSKSNPGTHERRLLMILMRARWLYVDLCHELERADQDNNARCGLLSNCADDLDSFIAGIERLQEVKS